MTILTLSPPGLDPSLVRKVCAIKNSLDRRVQRSVFGDETVTDAQRDALRCIRTGNYSNVRLLALLGQPDTGTKADPFKGFQKLTRAIASAKLSLSFATLIQATCSASPGLAASALEFFKQLLKKLLSAIEEGTDWSAITNYYISIIRKATKPASDYAFGEGTQAHATLDVAWIHQNTDAYEELCANTQQTRAEKAANQACAAAAKNGGGGSGGGGGGGDGGGGGGNPGPKSKKRRNGRGGGGGNDNADKPIANSGGGGGGGSGGGGGGSGGGGGGTEKEKKKKNKTTLLLLGPDAGAVRASSAILGNAVPIPTIDGGGIDIDALKAWADEFGLASEQGNRPCWNFWHSQGCSRAKCPFSHDEA